MQAITANDEANQARTPAVPLAGDASFGTNLQNALQADPAGTDPSWGGTSAPKGAAGFTANSTAKNGPQRSRKGEAPADGGASGQPGVGVQLASVQAPALPWKIPADINLDLQAPPALSDTQRGGESAAVQSSTKLDIAGLLPFGSGVATLQQDGQGIAPVSASQVSPAASTGDADVDSAEIVSPSTPPAALPQATSVVSLPGLLSKGEHPGAQMGGVGDMQVAASTQHANAGISARASSTPKDVAVADSPAVPTAETAMAPAPPILQPAAQASATTGWQTAATAPMSAPASRKVSKLVQDPSVEDASSSMPTQTPDVAVSPFNLLDSGDQNDVVMAKISAPSGPKTNDGKSDGKASLLDAVSPAPMNLIAGDQAQGQPSTPSHSAAHQTANTASSQAHEAQAPGAAAMNLQRALGRSEVQVHIDAAEYGRVSVHASYGRDGLAARIRLEDTALASALGSALSADAPNLEQRLRGDLGTRALVSVSTESGSARGDGDAGQGESRSRDQPRALPMSRNANNYSSVTNSAATSVRSISSSTRLDVHI